MPVHKFRVQVVSEIEVEINDSIFTEEFMDEFAQTFYDFESMEEHAKHLAWCEANNIVSSNRFLEGYGRLSEAGVSVQQVDGWSEIVDEEGGDEEDE